MMDTMFLYSTTTLKTHSNISSADDCARLCSNEARCIGYNYITTAFANSLLHRKCSLFSSVGTTFGLKGYVAGRCEVSK